MLGIGFVGSIFWFVSPDATAVYYGTVANWHPLLVGVLIATGLCLAYVPVYYGGEQLVRRWSWLERQVTRTRTRYERWMHKGYLVATAAAALIGIPPLLGMVALASGFGIGARPVIIIAFTGRATRFTIMAFLGHSIWG